MAAGMKPTAAPKPIVQSKTVWGAVAMLAALLLQQHGLASSQEAEQAGAQLETAAEAITALIGFILVIWGRISAKRPIKFPG